MRKFTIALILLLLISGLSLLLGLSFSQLLKSLFLLGLIYLFSKGIKWLKRKFLWKVRNKLIISHFLIGFIPLILLVILNFIVIFVLVSGFTNLTLRSWFEHRLDRLEILAHSLQFRSPEDEGVEVLKATEKASARILKEFSLLGRKFKGVIATGEKTYIAYFYPDRKVLLREELSQKLAQQLRKKFGFYINFYPFFIEVFEESRGGMTVRVKGTPSQVQLKRGTFMFPFALVDYDIYNAEKGSFEKGVAFIVSADISSLINVIFKGKDIFSSAIFRLLIITAFFFSFLNLLAILMGGSLVLQITSSVKNLSKATKRLQMGDFSYRIPIKREDELGSLARSFNKMAESISNLLEKEKIASILEDELRLARKIQLRLLPKTDFNVSDLEIAARAIPAKEVGGDFYDIIPKGNSTYFLMADVSGKGVSAALYASMLKGIVSSLVLMSDNLKEIVIKLNKLLSPHLKPFSFITLNLARIENRLLTYVRIGHQPALIYRPFEGIEYLTSSGLGLGVGNEKEFEKHIEVLEIPLQRGDVVVFFTDGLSELGKEEMFGFKRLEEILKRNFNFPVEFILEKILKEAINFYGEEHVPDDIALLIVRVK